MTKFVTCSQQSELEIFEATILSEGGVKLRHLKEGHLYRFKVEGTDGNRVLSDPVTEPGSAAHDPLAFRHAAVIHAQAIAVNAHMIDETHSVHVLHSPALSKHRV